MKAIAYDKIVISRLVHCRTPILLNFHKPSKSGLTQPRIGHVVRRIMRAISEHHSRSNYPIFAIMLGLAATLNIVFSAI